MDSGWCGYLHLQPSRMMHITSASPAFPIFSLCACHTTSKTYVTSTSYMKTQNQCTFTTFGALGGLVTKTFSHVCLYVYVHRPSFFCRIICVRDLKSPLGVAIITMMQLLKRLTSSLAPVSIGYGQSSGSDSSSSLFARSMAVK